MDEWATWWKRWFLQSHWLTGTGTAAAPTPTGAEAIGTQEWPKTGKEGTRSLGSSESWLLSKVLLQEPGITQAPIALNARALCPTLLLR